MVGLGAFIVLLSGLAAYWRATDETRLRALAQKWLESTTGGEARIGSVRFSLFEGLRLNDVAVAVPAAERFDPNDNGFEARTVCRAATIFLRLNPLNLRTDDLVVPEVAADDAELTLLYRSADGRWNFQEMLAHRTVRGQRIKRLPEVRLRSVRVLQQRLDAGGRSKTSEHQLDGHVRPDPEQPILYRITLTRTATEGGPGTPASETAEVWLDLAHGTVAGSLPSLAIRDLMLAAPPEAAQALDALAASGNLRVERFRYDPDGEWAATVAVRDIGMSVPVCQEDRAAPPSERYLRFVDATGTVQLDATGAKLDLKGRLREASIAVEGKLVLPEKGALPERLAAMGFDLTWALAGLPLPRDDDAPTEAESRFVQAIPELQSAVVDFDGRGPVDAVFHLTRDVGPDGSVQFAEGTLTFRGASARYIRFPYRLSDMTGVVHFRPDGLIELKDVAGRQDRNHVTINGLLGGRVYKGGELEIVGRDIALDEALLRCLEPEEAEAIRKFNADVRAEVHVAMTRPPVPLTEEAKPWETKVAIDFQDGSLDMTWFPYPLDGLTGRLEIDGGRMAAHDLRARHGSGEVRVNGQAEHLLEPDASLDLDLKATGVALDAVLGRALPDSGRRLFDMLQPGGRGDIQGRLFTPSPGEPLACDLSADVANGSIALPGTDEVLTGVQARMRIEPQRLTLSSFEGSFHESQVRIDGTIPLDEQSADLSLHLHSPHLALDDRLRAVLPAAAGSVWDQFSPEGAASVDVRYGYDAVATTRPAPATQPAGDAAVPYAVVIEPLDARACYEAFALPAEGLTGRVRVTRDAVTIERLAGRTNEGTFELAGRVTLDGDRTETVLTVEARDVAFSETLREALPWRLRRLYNDYQPQGRFDLSLDPLRVTVVAPEEPAQWSLQGRLALREATLDAGVKLSGIVGTIDGQVAMEGDWSADGRFELAKLAVDGRPVTDVRAQFARPAGGTQFVIDKIFGRFCEGRVAGRLEIDEQPQGAVYGVSLSAHELSLGAFLNKAPDGDPLPTRLEGRVTGHLNVVGRFGDYASRRGGGSVSIHQAQMLRVPLLVAMMRVLEGSLDEAAFHDVQLRYTIDGESLILDEIDLRGRGLSMIGAGRVHTPTQTLDLALLVGGPVRLPRLEVLSEFMEGVARELVEVRVEGPLSKPSYRTEIVRSARKVLDTITQLRQRSN